MVWELINIILISWIYFYLIKLYQSGCKCALTPNYYFLAFYISLTFVMFALSMFANNGLALSIYFGLVFVYFIITIIFIFVTFGYIRELEEEKCKCAGELGPDVLVVFALVRILSFVLALFALIALMNGRSKVVSMTAIKSVKSRIKTAAS